MYLFGGYTRQYINKRQILMIDDCELKKVGDLPFNFTYGACAQRQNKQVFLCFHRTSRRECYESNGPLDSYTKLSRSNYDHLQVPIAVTDGKHLKIFNTKIAQI